MVIVLRVGVFYPTLNVYGGAEFVTAVIANSLAKNNYDVVLFTNEKVDQQEMEKFFGERLHPSIKVIVKPTMFRPRELIDFYQTIFRSYSFKLKCDIWIDVYSSRIYPWTNICYIHFPYLNHYLFNRSFPYLKSGRFSHVGMTPYVFFEKNMVKYDKKLILANSRYTAEEIRRFSGAKAKVLYPPVPSIVFETNTEELFKNPRKNLVITISRFGPGKGLENIPYIASLTNARIKFAIIGRVHYKDTLLSLQRSVKKLGLTKRVKFFPNISKNDMKKILISAKIYLHTMVGEHFGISVVEAMAMGCIPIVHNSGGAKEFVPAQYRYENLRDAATKIETEIYEWTPEKAKETEKIAKRFSEENFSKEFIKIFNQYIEEGNTVEKK